MLIGFVGIIGAGKSHMSKVLTDEYNTIVSRVGLESSVFHISGTIKEITKILFPDWGEDHIRGKFKEEVDPKYFVSPRKVQQFIGEKMRELNEDVFLYALLGSIKRKYGDDVSSRNFVAAVDDVRFENDFSFIKSKGGIMIGIVPDEDRRKIFVKVDDSSMKAPTEVHAEGLVKKCDFVIHNKYDDFSARQVKMLAKIFYDTHK